MQHNKYSAEGWLGARNRLAQCVREGVMPAAMRNRSREQVARGKRKQSIVRGPKLAAVDSIRWARTIADVRLDDAPIYCADIRKWAEQVLLDSETLTS